MRGLRPKIKRGGAAAAPGRHLRRGVADASRARTRAPGANASDLSSGMEGSSTRGQSKAVRCERHRVRGTVAPRGADPTDSPDPMHPRPNVLDADAGVSRQPATAALI